MARGRLNGIVCDSGSSISHTVPVVGGVAIKHACQVSTMAGLKITEKIHKITVENGLYSADNVNMKWHEELRLAKENVCFISHDPSAPQGNGQPYILPDNTSLNLGMSRYLAGEELFKKDKDGQVGIQNMIYNSIQAVCPDSINVEWENDFYGNIYLSGGTMLFKGIE